MNQVLSCSVETCNFNNSSQCKAPAITVNVIENHADCDTFHPRQQ